MPRNPRTAKAGLAPQPVRQAVIPSNSLTASSMRYVGRAPRLYRPTAEWQKDCYRHFEICGEARYAATYFGNALSRMTLHAATMTSKGPVRQESGQAVDDLAALFAGKAGQAQMLKAIGIHLVIAGECFVVGRVQVDELDGEEDYWEVVSVLEMKVSGDKWTIHYGEKMADVVLTEEDVVIRIWTPHPAKRIEADSPFRSLLPILSEIEWLTKHIFKQVSSRLTGSGILAITQGIDFPPARDADGKPKAVANEAEGFMLALGENMLEPINNPAAPEAAVPYIISVNEEVMKNGGKVADFIKFWSELDANAKELRDEAIRRFAVGMDLEPEAVLGMSSNSGTGGGTSTGVSHWGAWQIEESTIKLHIEPMAETIVNAFTMGYLRPLTGNPTDLVVYDSTTLKLRPDRSKESLELNDRGIIKDAVTAKENGFTDDDLMGTDDRKQWLLRKIASGSATPDQVAAAAKQLGVDIPTPGQGAGPATREARPAPSLEDHPTRPRTPERAALLAASDALAFRALERVGNRLRQKSGIKPDGVPSFEMHTMVAVNGDADALLADAWSCAPQVLTGIGVTNPEGVVQVLSNYCKTLFYEQAPHTRERLETWLRETT